MSGQEHDVEMLRELLMPVEGEPGEHPSLTTLADYLQGLLEVAGEEQVQQHLVNCKACTTELLDLQTILDPEAGVPGSDQAADPISELGLEAAWRQLSLRLGAERQAKASRRTARLTAVAALVVGAIMTVVALRAGRLAPWITMNSPIPDPTAEQHQGAIVNPVMVFLEPGARGATGETSRLTLGPSDEWIILVLAPEVLDPAASYEITARPAAAPVAAGQHPSSSQTQAPAWRWRGLVLNEHGTVRVLVPSEVLAEGVFAVTLEGVTEEQRQVMGRYELEIESWKTDH